jgi:hypothetical protein
VRLQSVARGAEAVVGKVRTLAVASAVAGLWLWGLVAYPFGFEQLWAWPLAVTGLLLLLIPAAVLFLFYFGLNQLIRLPGNLAAMGTAGREHAGQLYTVSTDDGEPRRSRRRWRFLRTLFELRGLVLESRELLIGSAALVRLVNPVSLVVVAAAVVGAVVLIGVALVGAVGVVLGADVVGAGVMGGM